MNKLIFVIDDISGTGGVERVTSFLANNLIQKYNIIIISLSSKRHTNFYSINDQITIYNLNAISKFKKYFLITKIIRKEKPTCVISMSMGRLSFKLSILKVIFRLKVKLILSEHNAFRTSTKLIRQIKLLSYFLSDHLILLTNFDKNILEKKIKTPITVIPNFSIYEKEYNNTFERKKIVLSIGRISYQKSFDRALKIWGKVNRNDWKYIIVGDGTKTEKNKLELLCEQLSLKDSVIFMPPSKDLSLYYSQASIYMMTSQYEGLPLVLIESKSFGLPAIAYDCETGPSEIINNGLDGYLIEQNNESEFINKLNYLLENKEQRENFSLAALKNSSNFSTVKYLSMWNDILEKYSKVKI